MSSVNATNTDDNVFFIHKLGNDFKVQRGFDVWLYLAYSFLLVSLNINIKLNKTKIKLIRYPTFLGVF